MTLIIIGKPQEIIEILFLKCDNFLAMSVLYYLSSFLISCRIFHKMKRRYFKIFPFLGTSIFFQVGIRWGFL